MGGVIRSTLGDHGLSALGTNANWRLTKPTPEAEDELELARLDDKSAGRVPLRIRPVLDASLVIPTQIVSNVSACPRGSALGLTPDGDSLMSL